LCLSILRKVCCSDLSVCLSLYLSLYRSICLCVSLSIYLPMFAHTLSIVCFTQHLLSIEGFTQHLSIYPCSHTHTPDKTMQIYNLCKCVWGGGGGYALGVKGAVARKGCGSCLSYSKIKNIQYEALSLSIYIYISLFLYLSLYLSISRYTHPPTDTHTHTHTHTHKRDFGHALGGKVCSTYLSIWIAVSPNFSFNCGGMVRAMPRTRWSLRLWARLRCRSRRRRVRSARRPLRLQRRRVLPHYVDYLSRTM
jgi:hypothetical protein